MESISLKLQRGDYVNRLPCSTKAEHELWENENGRLEVNFKKDLFAELEITNHPKAENLYDIAWHRCYRLGRQEIINFAYELVSLLEG